MGRIRRWAVLLFAVGFLLSAGRTVAQANQATSGTGDLGVHAGRHFYDQSVIQDNPSKVSTTRTWVSGGSAPTGWIGSEARMYSDRGGVVALCGTSGMIKSPWATSSYSAQWLKESGWCGGAGYYFTGGKSGCWNGNGYDYYWSLRTPDLYLLS